MIDHVEQQVFRSSPETRIERLKKMLAQAIQWLGGSSARPEVPKKPESSFGRVGHKSTGSLMSVSEIFRKYYEYQKLKLHQPENASIYLTSLLTDLDVLSSYREFTALLLYINNLLHIYPHEAASLLELVNYLILICDQNLDDEQLQIFGNEETEHTYQQHRQFLIKMKTKIDTATHFDTTRLV